MRGRRVGPCAAAGLAAPWTEQTEPRTERTERTSLGRLGWPGARGGGALLPLSLPASPFSSTFWEVSHFFFLLK